MAKRVKRLEKGIESLKKEIEEHFSKIERDISENNFDRGRYHVKEIDKSLLKALEIKMAVLGIQDDSIKIFRERLEKIKASIGLDELI